MRHTLAITIAFFGFVNFAAADQYSSSVDLCNQYSDALINESGKSLAKIGESPVDIRRTVTYYCMKGIYAASEAKSESEIDLWRESSLSELSGINPKRDEYKANVIEKVAKVAHDFYRSQNSLDDTGKR